MISQSFSKCFLVDIYRISPESTLWEVVNLCFKESRVLAIVLFRISQYLWAKKIIWRLAPFVKRMNEIFTGFECHLSASIDTGLLLAHTQNIVIGEGVCIGKDVTIYNGVTLGSVSRDYSDGKNKYPEILDGAVIYSGAKVLGGIIIGKGAVIGANAVVLCSVPDGCIAVGVPARVKVRKGNL